MEQCPVCSRPILPVAPICFQCCGTLPASLLDDIDKGIASGAASPGNAYWQRITGLAVRLARQALESPPVRLPGRPRKVQKA